MTAPPDPRLDKIMEVLLAFARKDFTQRAPVSDELDTVDAIATGLNMLAEELTGAIKSQRELEVAYRGLQQAQARLVHAGKLVAIGQLASGVAHEINNPAGWVLLSMTALTQQLADLAQAVERPGASAEAVREGVLRKLPEMRAALADAAEGLDRIRSVTGDLRTFSRADGDEVEPVPLAELVGSAVRLARPTLRHRAQVTVQVAPELAVLGNRGRLGQVVTNLLVNAAQAVNETSRPDEQIRIEGHAVGGQAVLVVEDSGPGVRVDLRERIFEPFFTTKPAEAGTGLGLSLVAEIVQRHGGTVRVGESRWGGARFEVLLPRVSLPRPLEVAPPSAPSTRRGRVLMVDDEPRLLRSYGLLLGGEHEVVLAHGGREALALLERDGRFDLILCDLQMPEVDGVAVYERLAATAPEVAARIVFATGGVYQPRVRDFLARTALPVLQKPLAVDALFELIAQRTLEPANPGPVQHGG
jgi:signal transduction histidine kinase